ncbi:MAG: ferrous iron transport protein A [Caldimicrobium sp.]
MTLNEAKCGDVVVIKGIKDEDVLAKKLTAMGIRKNETFEVLKKCGRNLLIINNSTRLVLSNKLANKIEVEIIDKKPCVKVDISCDFSEELCPNIEDFSEKKHRKKHRLRHRWGFLKKFCPFLKD